MIQVSDNKKIIKKIETVIEYHTANYSVVWEGFFMAAGNAYINM